MTAGPTPTAPSPQPPSAAGPGALWAARAYYFFFFSAIGAYYPYIGLYYKQAGLSGQLIGTLTALTPLAVILASPLWGALGDRFRIHRTLLPLVTWGALVPTLVMAYTQAFPQLAVLVTLASLFSAPISPLIDSAVLDLVEGTPRSYGSIRVWGTPGYILTTWIMSGVLKQTGLVGLFYAYAGCMLLAGVAALWLPARRHHQAARNFSHGLGQLLRQPALLLFLVSVFLAGTAFAAYNAFFSISLQDMGASLALISLANVTASLSELPVLSLAAHLLRRLGVRGTLILSYAAYTLRWAILALARTPLVVLVPQLGHGLSWGAMTVGGVAYVKAHSPAGLEATGQSLFNASAYGLGATVGALTSGWVYDQFGAARLFTVMSACCAAGLVIFLMAPARPTGQP